MILLSEDQAISLDLSGYLILFALLLRLKFKPFHQLEDISGRPWTSQDLNKDIIIRKRNCMGVGWQEKIWEARWSPV